MSTHRSRHQERPASDALAETVTAQQIAALSRWVNGGPTYVGLDFETRGWRRLAKMTEEDGEVTLA